MNERTNVQLELSRDEVELLTAHLHRHLDQVDKELIRTEKHQLQHAIALESRALEAVLTRLERLRNPSKAQSS